MKKVMILMLAGLLLICPMSIAEEGTEMQILITDGTHEIVFALNNTPAAKSLAAQLPLETEIENYGSNEKIFYPPEKLDGTEAIESGGEAGGRRGPAHAALKQRGGSAFCTSSVFTRNNRGE